MKESVERDEYSSQMTSAFDHTNPGDEVKNKIYYNIMDECDNGKRKRTSMQSIFLVRRVCMACVMLLAVIVISGGAFTSVNSIINNNKLNDNIINKGADKDSVSSAPKDENELGKEQLINILRGQDTDFDMVTGNIDGRLADALEKSTNEIEVTSTQNYKFTSYGVIQGAGITDELYDKSIITSYAAVKVDNINGDVKSNYYQFNINQAVMQLTNGEHGENPGSYKVLFSSIKNRAEDGKSVYMVIDLQEYIEASDKNMKLCVTTTDLTSSMSYSGTKEEIAEDDYPIIPDKYLGYAYNENTSKEHVLFPIMIKGVPGVRTPDASLIDYSDNPEETYKNCTASDYSKFQMNHDKEYTADGVKFISDGIDSAYNHSVMWNYDEDTAMVYTDFNKYSVEGDSIKDVTFTLRKGEFVEKVMATEEEERRYEEDGYIASMRTNTNSDKPYTLYRRCGNTITFKYGENNSDKYGILMDIPISSNECARLDTGVAYYVDFPWIIKYIADNSITITANKTDGSTVDAKIETFVIPPMSSYYDEAEYNTSYVDGILQN